MKQIIILVLVIVVGFCIYGKNTIELLEACQEACEDKYQNDKVACIAEQQCIESEIQEDENQYNECVAEANLGVSGCSSYPTQIEAEKTNDELSVEFSTDYYNCYWGCSSFMQTEQMRNNLQCQAKCSSPIMSIQLILLIIAIIMIFF